MSRNVRLEVLWAIRDCRDLCAQEKALLWAIESRGVHYGTWETVAADAGMKKDAYYRWRGRLESTGVLSVTERPGTTTVHEVNADWFALDTIPVNANSPSGNPAYTPAENRNDPSGNPAIEGNSQVDHEVVYSREPKMRRIGEPIYIRMVRPDEMNAWDRAEHGIDSMSSEERADWDALLESEAHLP